MKKSFAFFSLFLVSMISFSQTQGEMNAAEHKNYLKADAELNSVYKMILLENKEDTAFLVNLKASQKIWMKFRDAEMKMKYPKNEEGIYGSVLPMCWSIYLTGLTNNRIETLKEWLEVTEEGDVCAGSVKRK